MLAIDSEVLQLRLPLLEPEPLQRQRYLRSGSGDIVIVVVPGEDRRTPSVPAGQRCVAVVGPNGKMGGTLRTGSADRVANMRAFAAEARKLMDEQLT